MAEWIYYDGMSPEQTMKFWVWLSAGMEDREGRHTDGNKSARQEWLALSGTKQEFLRILKSQKPQESNTPFESTYMAVINGLDRDGKERFENYLMNLARCSKNRSENVR